MTLEEIDRATRSALVPLRIVCEIFGTSLSGAYGLADRGELETVKLGRKRFAKTAPIRSRLGLAPIANTSEQAAA